MALDISYLCPQCGEFCRDELAVDKLPELLSCRCCDASLGTNRRAVDSVDGQLRRCLVCPSEELFVRKDFPQRLGVLIVTVGFLASCVAWYFHMLITTFAILFATALVDVALYLLVGDLLECYRCHAQYRGVEQLEQHGSFDLEVHERHRQMQARQQQAEAAVSSTDSS